MIDCERQLVTIRDHSGGVLTVYDEGTRTGSTFCSAARARQSLQQCCRGFVAYVMDARVDSERPKSVDEVPIVREFPDVFPEELSETIPDVMETITDVFLEELSGVPPERQVESGIEFVPRVAPIAKAPYRLAPPEMQELSSQLQELLGKGFIRPSSSPWGAPTFLSRRRMVHTGCALITGS